MKKVIIINGVGSSGKDTFINVAINQFRGKYKIFNFSSIDPIKRALRKHYGWNGKDKNDEWRKKMSDLKKSYGDQPTLYLIDKINREQEGIFFLHIREPSEIDKMKRYIPVAHTLLITRKGVEVPNNESDRSGSDYKYDTRLSNDGSSEEDIIPLVREFFESTIPSIGEFNREIEYSRGKVNEMKLR